MVIKDKIYIDLLNERVDQTILPQLVYKNPEYFQKLNMGIAVKKYKKGVVVDEVPPQIETYKINGGSLEILRGEYQKIKEWIKHLDFNLDHPDHRGINLQYINNKFDLDQYQEGSIEAIKNHKQGIIHAVTSAGKSLIILKAICELDQKALIIVHRMTLLQQFLEDIDRYIRDANGNKIKPGIVGGGKFSLGPITIAIDKTLSKHLPEIREAFGTVFLDECHLAPANTMLKLVNGINSPYRFGVTGTLKRKDGKEFLIYSTFGQVLFKVGKEELEKMGRVVPVKVEVIDSKTKFDIDGAIERYGSNKARQMQEKAIAFNPDRNQMIVDLIPTLPGKTIILSRYVAPCKFLSDQLKKQYNINSGIITGENSKKALEDFEKIKNGKINIVFATIGCVSTGVSISDLNNLVLISPIYTNELLLHQIRGRLMRTADGKAYGTLYFIYDPFIFGKHKLNEFKNIMGR